MYTMKSREWNWGTNCIWGQESEYVAQIRWLPKRMHSVCLSFSGVKCSLEFFPSLLWSSWPSRQVHCGHIIFGSSSPAEWAKNYVNSAQKSDNGERGACSQIGSCWWSDLLLLTKVSRKEVGKQSSGLSLEVVWQTARQRWNSSGVEMALSSSRFFFTTSQWQNSLCHLRIRQWRSVSCRETFSSVAEEGQGKAEIEISPSLEHSSRPRLLDDTRRGESSLLYSLRYTAIDHPFPSPPPLLLTYDLSTLLMACHCHGNDHNKKERP